MATKRPRGFRMHLAEPISLRLKFNVVLAAMFLISICASGLYYKQYLEQNAFDEVLHDSELLMATAIATRAYTTEQIKPLLDPLNGQRFMPQTVPAYAATETIRLLSQHYPGYEYREAVLNPTNPRDKATEWEKNLIGQFRTNRTIKELNGEQGAGYDRSIYIAKPIAVTQRQCLACHSTPEVAPTSMRVIYGDKNGFNWELDDIIGMQIVRVPMLYPLEKARQAFNNFMLSLFVVFGLIFIGLNITLRFLVISPIARTNAKLEELATKDFLTNLVNRRVFLEQLESAIAEARIHSIPVSVIILDIDFFKRINDTFGHTCGDMVLQEMSHRLQEHMPETCCCARFGGEEFIILVREKNVVEALLLAEKMRLYIAQVPFEHVGAVSASFGVAQWQNNEEPRALINRADKALYEAKHSGRNKVIRASDAPASRQFV